MVFRLHDSTTGQVMLATWDQLLFTKQLMSSFQMRVNKVAMVLRHSYEEGRLLFFMGLSHVLPGASVFLFAFGDMGPSFYEDDGIPAPAHHRTVIMIKCTICRTMSSWSCFTPSRRTSN
ncbi:hypothetical protein OH492_12915 [Vibrio chagasii]|nr:hypothetical protein [Vibrio chagasii]